MTRASASRWIVVSLAFAWMPSNASASSPQTSLRPLLAGTMSDATYDLARRADVDIGPLGQAPEPGASLSDQASWLLSRLDVVERLSRSAILDPSAAVRVSQDIEAVLSRAAATLNQNAKTDPTQNTMKRLVQNAKARSASSHPGMRFMSANRLQKSADRAHQIARRLPSIVDSARLHRAAATLADALDRGLPGLQRHSGIRSTTAATPCDLARDGQRLCISSEADHMHTEEFRLSIDLGGNDVYTNSAGAAVAYTAGPIGPNEISERSVSVVIDVAGDDRYAHALDPANPGSRWGAQASGLLGGVGALLDLAGNDLYSTITSAPGSVAAAQGYAVAGVGFFADLKGSDTYEIEDRFQEKPAPTDNSNSSASGQARAVLGGVAIALDRGAGDDSYRVISTPDAKMFGDWLEPAQASASGFGIAALGGASLHSDDGGSDTYEILAQGGAVAPHDLRPIRAGWGSASGFGVTIFGGTAISVSGVGDTMREVIGRASAPAVQLTVALAYGSGGFGSGGTMHDLGGDDVYLAEALASAERTGVIDDDFCGCSQYEFRALSAPYQGSAVLSHGGLAFVSGDTGNAGLLHDHGGNDRYEARAVTRSTVAAQDRRTHMQTPDGKPALISGLAVSGLTTTQSHGSGFSNGAEGSLIDDGGDDTYEIEAANDADVHVTAQLPGIERMGRAWRNSVITRSLGWGGFGGSGSFLDHDGSDTYSNISRGAATAEPETELIDTEPSSESMAVVDVFGIARFIDGGLQSDTITMLPYRESCQGTRGEGIWVDCSPSGVAIGYNIDSV